MRKKTMFQWMSLALLCSALTAQADEVITSQTNQSVSRRTLRSTTTDVSPLRVTAGTLTVDHCRLFNAANASSTDKASFTGVNAVMLAFGTATDNGMPGGGDGNGPQGAPPDGGPMGDEGGDFFGPRAVANVATKSGPVILSSYNYIAGSGRGANGIFAYGDGRIKTAHDTIYQTGGNARAIMASGGGTIEVDNDVATTFDNSSSVIATDRGGGTITVNGGSYTANGYNSAGIYSTGDITARGASFTSNGGEMFVIEGANRITVDDCRSVSNKDKWGVLLYQSFSGDAQGTTGCIRINGGSLTYNGHRGGVFYNTNATDTIRLSGVDIISPCDTLLRAIKGGWGNRNTARRGGTSVLFAKGQKLRGIIFTDAFSSAYITLSDGSNYSEASINPSATGAEVSLTLDATSRLSLAADCYINGPLSIVGLAEGKTPANVQSNGHSIFYAPTANAALQGRTFALEGGGKITPKP